MKLKYFGKPASCVFFRIHKAGGFQITAKDCGSIVHTRVSVAIMFHVAVTIDSGT